MNSSLQKSGGLAAFGCMIAYIVGFLVYLTLLESAQYGSSAVPATQHVAFLVEHQTLLYAWNLIIYVASGVFLAVLTPALHDRLKLHAPALSQTAAVFGLIWSGLVIASGMVANIGTSMIVKLQATNLDQAAILWRSHALMINGLGGGNEIVGGLWIFLSSLAAKQTGQFSKGFNILGLIVGAAGLVTVIPPLSEVGSIFGLGSIIWFGWLGTLLLKKHA